MIAVTGAAEVAPATSRAASAGVSARARIATRTARLRSVEAEAGVKRKSPLRLVPRRASAAASRGSETAGVKAPTGRACSSAAAAMRLVPLAVAAKAGASTAPSRSAMRSLPLPMARSFLTDVRLPSDRRFSTSRVAFPAKRIVPALNHSRLLQDSHNAACPR